MSSKKKTPIKSYQFKLPKNRQLNWFQKLTTKAAEKFLDELWSEEWIKKLGKSSLKAYKVINEAQVKLDGIYLPSRVRRGVAEWAGRIIRGQYKRFLCYKNCMEIVSWLGVETKESKLIAVVMQHYRTTTKNGKNYPKYKKVMVQQTIAMIKNWHQRLGSGFADFNYTDHVQPKIKYYLFPYSPDDGQAIQFDNTRQRIQLQMKLPKTAQPRTKSDWQWSEQELPVPITIQEKIKQAISSKPLKPTLRKKTLRGGLEYFFLQFPWEYSKSPLKKRKERILAVDLGLKKVAIAAVFEKGKQISRPVIIKLKGSEYKHIERLYKHIAYIQHQVAKQKKKKKSKQVKVVRREEERRRLHEKRNRLGEELAHTATNIIVQMALKWDCTKIVIEDLRDYKPPRGRRSWSRRLSQWLRGRIALLLEYKCKEAGITLQKVCPWGTSSHCPRCTAKGRKVKGPNNLIEDDRGRWFHCQECGFAADRDYIAVVNIYRASFIDYRKIKSLKDTRPVPYTDSGIPHSTALSGGSEMNCNNLLVTVTGNG